MPRKKKIEKTETSVVQTLAEEIVKTVSKDEPQKEETLKYVVVRDDRRVSDNEYTDPKDPKAVGERDFWQRICKRWSPSEKTSIVKYNKKKHRNW